MAASPFLKHDKYVEGMKQPCVSKSQSQSPFPRPIVHRASPISVSIALGHASANAVKATVGAGQLVAQRV